MEGRCRPSRICLGECLIASSRRRISSSESMVGSLSAMASVPCIYRKLYARHGLGLPLGCAAFPFTLGPPFTIPGFALILVAVDGADRMDFELGSLGVGQSQFPCEFVG